jgi:hypothetical protein
VSYYVKGMGAALIAECNQERLTFRGGTGLLACQLRDTLRFADAACDRISKLEAALRIALTDMEEMNYEMYVPHLDNPPPSHGMIAAREALGTTLEKVTKRCTCNNEDPFKCKCKESSQACHCVCHGL